MLLLGLALVRDPETPSQAASLSRHCPNLLLSSGPQFVFKKKGLARMRQLGPSTLLVILAIEGVFLVLVPLPLGHDVCHWGRKWEAMRCSWKSLGESQREPGQRTGGTFGTIGQLIVSRAKFSQALLNLYTSSMKCGVTSAAFAARRQMSNQHEIICGLTVGLCNTPRSDGFSLLSGQIVVFSPFHFRLRMVHVKGDVGCWVLLEFLLLPLSVLGK